MTLTTMIIGILIYLIVTPIIDFCLAVAAIAIIVIAAIILIYTIVEKILDFFLI